jgi:monovalent cation/hydrogen antiporter
VVQGLTIKPLMRRLQITADDTVEKEVQLARVEAMRAALATVAEPEDELSRLLRQRYELMLRRAKGELSAATPPLQRVIDAERARLLRFRDDETIGDAAFQQLEAELDLEELSLARLSAPGERPAAH